MEKLFIEILLGIISLALILSFVRYAVRGFIGVVIIARYLEGGI